MAQFEIGQRVRVVSAEQTRFAPEGEEHCNCFVNIELGTEGTIVPQFPNDGSGVPMLLWSDGTMLIRRDDQTLFSVWPELVELA